MAPSPPPCSREEEGFAVWGGASLMGTASCGPLPRPHYLACCCPWTLDLLDGPSLSLGHARVSEGTVLDATSLLPGEGEQGPLCTTVCPMGNSPRAPWGLDRFLVGRDSSTVRIASTLQVTDGVGSARGEHGLCRVQSPRRVPWRRWSGILFGDLWAWWPWLTSLSVFCCRKSTRC